MGTVSHPFDVSTSNSTLHMSAERLANKYATIEVSALSPAFAESGLPTANPVGGAYLALDAAHESAAPPEDRVHHFCISSRSSDLEAAKAFFGVWHMRAAGFVAKVNKAVAAVPPPTGLVGRFPFNWLPLCCLRSAVVNKERERAYFASVNGAIAALCEGESAGPSNYAVAYRRAHRKVRGTHLLAWFPCVKSEREENVCWLEFRLEPEPVAAWE
jgi:hypothetical protein